MESYPSGGDPGKQGHHERHAPKSTSELMASAKVLAGSFGGGKSGEMDKGRAAGAAADLLDAASHYGKLEEKSYGKYVDKAEAYLHQYGSSHSSSGSSPAPAAGQGHPAPAADHKPSEESEGGGYGDYMKMAQGFLKK